LDIDGSVVKCLNDENTDIDISPRQKSGGCIEKLWNIHSAAKNNMYTGLFAGYFITVFNVLYT
jgi:hypothetical protein